MILKKIFKRCKEVKTQRGKEGLKNYAYLHPGIFASKNFFFSRLTSHVSLGFTLAEVMITMAIVGVLSAILIPAINRVSPNNNKIMFRKAYYTLQRAVSMMINDDYNYPSGQLGKDSATPAATVQRGFNYTDKTGNGTSNKFCYYLKDILDTVGTNVCIDRTATGDSYFATADGIVWNIYSPYDDTTAVNTYTAGTAWVLDSTLYDTKVLIDVNGAKPPNCSADTGATIYGYYSLNNGTWSSGTFDTAATCNDPDRFVIGIRYDGKLQVGCTTASGTSCSSTTDSSAISILSAPTNNVKY